MFRLPCSTGGLAPLAAAVAAGVLAGPVLGDIIVVHDSREIVTSGTWNAARHSIIGGAVSFNGTMTDHQVSDDFTLTSETKLTRIIADFYHAPPLATPAEGWLVEIFPDIGGLPAEEPRYAITTMNVTRIGSFPAGAISPNPNTPDNRSTFEFDLTDRCVELDPGTWWISLVAVDTTPFGVTYRWVGLTETVLNGSVAAFRNGGLDHGNNLPGTTSGAQDWTPTTLIANSNPWELSMRLEGMIVPAPTSALALAAAAAGTARRRRRPPA